MLSCLLGSDAGLVGTDGADIAKVVGNGVGAASSASVDDLAS